MQKITEPQKLDVSNGLDNIIFKLPFFNPLFLDNDLLLDWSFSKTVLVTAYDIYRDDTFVTRLQQTGMTLREYLIDFGFNPKVNILADTGVFELEMKKGRLHTFDKYIEKLQTLKTEEIFHAYDLIDPDFLIAPDEMILSEDTKAIVNRKTKSIKDNLDMTLERFPRKKIIATIQGIKNTTIEQIISKISEVGIDKAARGGLIPLRRTSRDDFSKVLTQTETMARASNISHLHAFGLSHTSMLYDYFDRNSYDSVDTSAIYYYTVDRKYLTSSRKLVPVRKVNFDECDCDGCLLMEDNLRYADMNAKFAVGLYAHNAIAVRQMVTSIQNKSLNKLQLKNNTELKKSIKSEGSKLLASNNNLNRLQFSKTLKRKYTHKQKIIRKKPDYTSTTRIWNKVKVDSTTLDCLSSALDFRDIKKDENHQAIIHKLRRDFLDKSSINLMNCKKSKSQSILIISSCSKRKSQYLDIGYQELLNQDNRDQILSQYNDQRIKVIDLYTGYEITELKEGIQSLRNTSENDKVRPDPFVVDHLLISAGWGLLYENDEIVSYDATFNGHSTEELQRMCKELDVGGKLIKYLKNKKYDLIFIALSNHYLATLGDYNFLRKYAKEIVIFTSNYNLEEKLASSIHSNFRYFSVDEFWELENEHEKHMSFTYPIGRRIKAKGSIFRNYSQYLIDQLHQQNSKSVSFTKWWHELTVI